MNVLRRVSLTWQQKASSPVAVLKERDGEDRAKTLEETDAPQRHDAPEPEPIRQGTPVIEQQVARTLENQFMALANRKYAELPDLDPAPDIYETPELTDDASTVQTTTLRSTSPDESDLDESHPEIDRQQLRPRQARTHFLPAQVDAQDVDFSDNVSAKRKSYRTFSRRRRRRENGAEELGDFSDDEDESLERKLARLRREAEEVKEDLERRKLEDNPAEPAGETGVEHGVVELSRVLDDLHSTTRRDSSATAESSIVKKMSSDTTPKVAPQTDGARPEPTSITSSSLLSQAASFDDRLRILEGALGLPPSTVLPGTNQSPEAIIPSLAHLSFQLSSLASTLTGSLPSTATSTPPIDSLAVKIRALTTDADKLTSARKRATAAALAAAAARDRDDESDIMTEDGKPITEIGADDPKAKINALYASLPTITSLHPLLPTVLERLRSLRTVHVRAAEARMDLEEVERRQGLMREEIGRWREGLEAVEGKMREGEGVMKANVQVVGAWVKELEHRMGKF